MIDIGDSLLSHKPRPQENGGARSLVRSSPDRLPPQVPFPFLKISFPSSNCSRTPLNSRLDSSLSRPADRRTSNPELSHKRRGLGPCRSSLCWLTLKLEDNYFPLRVATLKFRVQRQTTAQCFKAQALKRSSVTTPRVSTGV